MSINYESELSIIGIEKLGWRKIFWRAIEKTKSEVKQIFTIQIPSSVFISSPSFKSVELEEKLPNTSQERTQSSLKVNGAKRCGKCHQYANH